MKTNLSVNLLYSGIDTGGQTQPLADRAIAQMKANKQWLTEVEVLVLCYHANTPHAESICAKIRRELQLVDVLPLTFGHSGSDAFAHALSLLEWLMTGGTFRRAVCVLADHQFDQSSLSLPVQENALSIIEVMSPA